jgi:hypothetical protein
LHWIGRGVWGSKGGYDMALENIFILFFVYAYYSNSLHNSYINKTLEAAA